MQVIYSIIIPVYKEKKIINNTIQNLKSLRNFKKSEIIIVDGDQDKSTLKNIIDNNVIKISSVKGRAVQMNTGADIAKGEILIFLHADTILPNNALDKIEELINYKKYKAGAFDLSIDSKKFIYKLISFISSIRSRITRIPYGDQAYFIRKDYFFYLGKFMNVPIMEDVDLMNRIKKGRGKIFIINEKVKTSVRRWEKEGVIRCTLRNWLLIIFYYMGFKPEKLVKFYR